MTNWINHDLSENSPTYKLLFVSCSSAGYANLTFLATIRAFYVTLVPEPIIFDDARINSGGYYNPNTGLYTAPLNGTCEFYVQLETYNYNGAYDNWGFEVVMDQKEISYTRYSSASNLPFVESISSTVLIHLSTGQYVYVEPVGLDGLYGSDIAMYSWFSGRLISAD